MCVCVGFGWWLHLVVTSYVCFCAVCVWCAVVCVSPFFMRSSDECLRVCMSVLTGGTKSEAAHFNN